MAELKYTETFTDAGGNPTWGTTTFHPSNDNTCTGADYVSGERFELVTSPTRWGGHAAKTHIDGQRAVLESDAVCRHRSLVGHPGHPLMYKTETWIGFSFYLANDFPAESIERIFLYTPSPNQSKYNSVIFLQGNEIEFVRRWTDDVGALNESTVYQGQNISLGAWHDIVMRIYIADDTTGYWQGWIDGVEVFHVTGVETGSNLIGDEPIPRFGIYWSTETRNDLYTIYQDEIRIAEGVEGFNLVDPSQQSPDRPRFSEWGLNVGNAYLTDNFNGTNGTTLDAHSPDLGGSWVLGASSMTLDGSGNVTANTVSNHDAVNQATLPSKQSIGVVTGTIGTIGSDRNISVLHRVTETGTDHYIGQVFGNHGGTDDKKILIGRWVGNATYTILVELVVSSISDSTEYTLKFYIRDKLNGDVELLLELFDGATFIESISLVDTDASKITSTNKSGFRLRTSDGSVNKVEFSELVLPISTSNKVVPIEIPLERKPDLAQTEVDWSNPINDSLVAWWLFNDGAGLTLHDIAGSSHGTLANMNPDTDWRPIGKHGHALNFDGINDYVEVGDLEVLDMGTSDLTILAWIKTSTAANQSIVNKRGSSTGNGYEVRVASDGKLEIYIKSSTSTFTQKKSFSTTYADGQWHHVVAAFDRNANVRFYRDSVADGTGDISGRAGNIDNIFPLRMGATGGTTQDFFNGLIDDVRIYNRALTDQEIQEVYQYPLGGLKPRHQFYVVPSLSGVTLSVHNIAHSIGIESPTLQQANTLSIQDVIHVQSIDNLVITQANVLTIADMIHTHGMDSPTLTQAHLLSVAESVHNHLIENVELSQASALTVEDILHSHGIDNVALTQANMLAVADLAHNHFSDNAVLAQANTLLIADVLHNHLSDNVELSQSVSLDMAKVFNQHLIDNIGLVQANTLSVNDTGHSHSIDSIVLTQANVLSVDEVTHAQLLDAINLLSGGTLEVDPMLYPQSMDTVTLTQASLLTVAEVLHSHTIDDVEISQANTLSVENSQHSQAVDNITLSEALILAVSDSQHSHNIDNVALLQAGVLALQSVRHAHSIDSVEIVQANVLAVNDALHSQATESVTLDFSLNIVVQDLAHGYTVDNVALTQGGVLTINDMAHAQSIEEPLLVQANVLTVADSYHIHTISQAGVIVGFIAEPVDPSIRITAQDFAAQIQELNLSITLH